jgi:hypothetical protein
MPVRRLVAGGAMERGSLCYYAGYCRCRGGVEVLRAPLGCQRFNHQRLQEAEHWTLRENMLANPGVKRHPEQTLNDSVLLVLHRR